MPDHTSVLQAIIGRFRNLLGEAADSARDLREQVREDPAAIVHSPSLRIGFWVIVALLGILAFQWFMRNITPTVGGAFVTQREPVATLYVACTNPACLASYTTQQKMDFHAWPLKCDTCKQPTVYRAALCPKCHNRFAIPPGATSTGCPLCAKKAAAEIKPAPASQKAVDRDDAEDGW